MTVNDSAAFLSNFGIAEEQTAGTAESAPSAYDYFTGDPGINPVQNVITLGHVQKREQVKKVLGAYHMEGSIPQIMEPEGMLPYWLKFALGSVTSSQLDTTSAYEHIFTPSDTLPSFTTWINRGNSQEVKIPYCMIDSLELQQSVDDALRATVNFVGQKEQSTSDFGNPSYSDLEPFMNHHLAVSVGGSNVPEVHNSTVQVQNNVDPGQGRVHGSRYFQGLVPGSRVISGSMDLYFDDSDEYERFWGDVTTPASEPQNQMLLSSLNLDWDTGIEIDTGYNYRLQLDIPSVGYESTSVNLDGERVVQTINWGAIWNDSSGYDIQATLQNSMTSL